MKGKAMIFDAAWDAVKTVACVGAVGFLVSFATAALKQMGLVKKMRLEDLLDQAAERVVAYVQDMARQTGASGARQREQAVKALTEKTGVDEREAEELIRAAYQKMKKK